MEFGLWVMVVLWVVLGLITTVGLVLFIIYFEMKAAEERKRWIDIEMGVGSNGAGRRVSSEEMLFGEEDLVMRGLDEDGDEDDAGLGGTIIEGGKERW